jgi:hypothetical protein
VYSIEVKPVGPQVVHSSHVSHLVQVGVHTGVCVSHDGVGVGVGDGVGVGKITVSQLCI